MVLLAEGHWLSCIEGNDGLSTSLVMMVNTIASFIFLPFAFIFIPFVRRLTGKSFNKKISLCPPFYYP